MNTFRKQDRAQADALDARVLAYLRKRGDEGAMRGQIFEDLAARATPEKLAVSLQRLERAKLVRRGERRGSEGQPRIAVPVASESSASSGGKAVA